MFKDILLPINISDPVTWEKPLETAIYLARSCGARLHVMTVVPSFDYPTVESFFPVGFEEKAHAKMGEELHAFVAEHVPKDITSQAIIAVGSVYEEILKTVERGQVRSDRHDPKGWSASPFHAGGQYRQGRPPFADRGSRAGIENKFTLAHRSALCVSKI